MAQRSPRGASGPAAAPRRVARDEQRARHERNAPGGTTASGGVASIARGVSTTAEGKASARSGAWGGHREQRRGHPERRGAGTCAARAVRGEHRERDRAAAPSIASVKLPPRTTQQVPVHHTGAATPLAVGRRTFQSANTSVSVAADNTRPVQVSTCSMDAVAMCRSIWASTAAPKR